MFCLKCGNKIPDNSKYCMYCGYNILIHDNNKKAMDYIKKKFFSFSISKKYKLLIAVTFIFIILLSCSILLINKSKVNYSKDDIIGNWSNEGGANLQVNEDSYSFIDDTKNPDNNFDKGTSEIYQGKEGLEKAGYDDDKINEILDKYSSDQVYTISTTTEKQNIGGNSISKFKNRNDYYILILKTKTSASGIRVLDEKILHLNKN